ncbi:uncharacterized protein LOC141726871 isoform X1 [Zonotrichia albicollis]|uniref:uncharacterized protein LOC141726871 isoform X1 n=1 Tax=Zonotrichia albicollis TaxID=44394 RepID=UPI003D80B9E3
MREYAGPGAFHPFPSPSPDPPGDPPGDPPEPPWDPPTLSRSPPGPSPPAEPSEKSAVSLSVPSPPATSPAREAERHAQLFCRGQAEEARNAADPAGSGAETPPPYGFEDGAETHGEGGSKETGGGNAVSGPQNACAGEEGEGAAPAVERETNQSALFKLGPYRARTSPTRRRGERREKERHHPRREERGRTEPGWDSETERAELIRFRAKPNKPLNNIEKRSQHKLTDWGKTKTACRDRAPAAPMNAFPVGVAGAQGNQRGAYTPVNLREAKAISERGVNSAVVPTFVNDLSNNNDLFTFDITQISRMLFDGAGRILFKQGWRDDHVSPGFWRKAATQRAVPSRHSFPRQHPCSDHARERSVGAAGRHPDAAAQPRRPPGGQETLVPCALTGSSQFCIPAYGAMAERSDQTK